MNTMLSIDHLLLVLSEIEAMARAWLALARAHTSELVEHRLEAITQSTQAMERLLERIGELEDSRQKWVREVAKDIGMGNCEDSLPRLEDLCGRLAEADALRLRVAGAGLREQLDLTKDLAQRNQVLADAARSVAAGSIDAVTKIAMRGIRSSTAYGRTGTRNFNTATPMYQRAWKA